MWGQSQLLPTFSEGASWCQQCVSSQFLSDRIGAWPLMVQVCQLLVHFPGCGSVTLLFRVVPPVYACPLPRANSWHLSSNLSQWGHWAGSSPCSWLGEKHSVRGGGNAARVVVDGGQRPLTAVLEGWVVGALVATVVMVHLTLALPPAVKDPDECLKTGNTSDEDKTSLWCSQQYKTRCVVNCPFNVE